MNAETKLLKVAWIRNPAPMGQTATGRLNCPCGKAPESAYTLGPDILCPCGRQYTWDGYLIENGRICSPVRLFTDDGASGNYEIEYH